MSDTVSPANSTVSMEVKAAVARNTFCFSHPLDVDERVSFMSLSPFIDFYSSSAPVMLLFMHIARFFSQQLCRKVTSMLLMLRAMCLLFLPTDVNTRPKPFYLVPSTSDYRLYSRSNNEEKTILTNVVVVCS